MIILDTNIVSEATKPNPSLTVLRWFDAQRRETLYFTAISLSEVLAGLAVMPDGKRKQHLSVDTNELLKTLFGSRILPFDAAAAEAYAEILKVAYATGRLMSSADAQIAAIAKSRGFAVATRDLKPFAAAGVEVIDPWS